LATKAANTSFSAADKPASAPSTTASIASVMAMAFSCDVEEPEEQQVTRNALLFSKTKDAYVNRLVPESKMQRSSLKAPRTTMTGSRLDESSVIQTSFLANSEQTNRKEN
tara:strand:+ start:999 stop:1328 length:330 start_codon:yes stop_codon:yes gene_type:complete